MTDEISTENKARTALNYIEEKAKKEAGIYIQGMIDMAFFAGLIGINKRAYLSCLYDDKFKK